MPTVPAPARTTAALSPPTELARDFASFCDGLEEAGYPEYARRGRVVAYELGEALRALTDERAARVALQARCDRLERILAAAHADDPISGLDPEP